LQCELMRGRANGSLDGESRAGACVVHLIASNFAGGPEKQILEQSSRLLGRGYRVVVGSFRENRPKVDVISKARERGLETFVIDTRTSFSPLAIRQLSRFLRSRKADVLVTHGYKANLVGYFATRRSGVLQLPMVRGYTWENHKIRVYEAIDRRLLRRFHDVLCVSGRTRELLVGFGVTKARIHVLHNAVDPNPTVVRADLHRLFGFPSGDPVVVSAGRLSPEKGHVLLVEALAILNRSGKRCPRCVILGSGPEESRLRNKIAKLGLADRVILGGFREDVIPYLAAADVVVNPSFTEGLPNVVLEAMSLGRAVVATDVGGVVELIAPGRTGWLVPAGDAPALAIAIEEVLTDSASAIRVGEAARSSIQRGFSFSRQVAEFLRIWSTVSRNPSVCANRPS
jgi:glycosyltransferase involved in cell wall biosynthesis